MGVGVLVGLVVYRSEIQIGLQLTVGAFDLSDKVIAVPCGLLVEGADVGAQEVDSVSALQRGEVADSPLHTLHVVGIGLASDVFYVIVL